MLKGFHLSHPPTNPAYLNQLGAAWWCGDDTVLRVIRDTAQQAQFAALTATYVYRIPHDASVDEIRAVQQLNNFNNEDIVLNEGDMHGISAELAATLAIAAITNIQAADPTRNNKIMLCAGSQLAGTEYVAAILDRLPLTILDLIDGLAWHYYPQADPIPGGVYDENRLRNFLNVVCPFTASRGFGKAWLSEWGWTDTANPARIANCLKRWVDVFDEFPIIKRHNLYGANIPDYTRLVGTTGLTNVGNSFKEL